MLALHHHVAHTANVRTLTATRYVLVKPNTLGHHRIADLNVSLVLSVRKIKHVTNLNVPIHATARAV